MLSDLDIQWIWRPLSYFELSGKRVFYVFLLSALGIVIVRALSQRGNRLQTLKSDFRWIFSFRTWSHPSSLVDIKCLFFNNWVSLLVFSYVVWNARFILIWIAHALDLWLNSKGIWSDWPQWLVTTLYTLVLFFCTDFSRFALHYALHRFSFLWRFHKVHHSAEVLTPLTVYRAHPIEMLLYRVRSILVVGMVSGIFYFLFMGKMNVWAILGVNGLGFLFNFLGSNLRHSHVWLSYGVLEHVFISPAQHQMHHNVQVHYSRRNIGSCLAVWDKLFKTHLLSKDMPTEDRANFGIEAEKLNHQPKSWLSSFWSPFLRA